MFIFVHSGDYGMPFPADRAIDDVVSIYGHVKILQTCIDFTYAELSDVLFQTTKIQMQRLQIENAYHKDTFNTCKCILKLHMCICRKN